LGGTTGAKELDAVKKAKELIERLKAKNKGKTGG
jgi:hypothetical protein